MILRAQELIDSIDGSLSPTELQQIKHELMVLFQAATAMVPIMESDPRHKRLSRREAEVMSMILEGKRLKEIAATLDISVKTVTTHRSRLLRKLDLDDNLGLYRYGIRHGLIAL